MATPNIEVESVHGVYEAIADHFSETRYRPWPVVEKFVDELSKYSLILDAGCGNGKNMPDSSDMFVVGGDRSEKLVEIAAKKNRQVYIGDTTCLPHASNSFDAVLSIAVIHHLSTVERRKKALSEILRVLRGGGEGKALIFVWAMENNGRIVKLLGEDYANAKRGSSADCDGGEGLDVMVPWRKRNVGDGDGELGSEDQEYKRYYHLFEEGELERLVTSVDVGGTVLSSGYDYGNWYCTITKG